MKCKHDWSYQGEYRFTERSFWDTIHRCTKCGALQIKGWNAPGYTYKYPTVAK